MFLILIFLIAYYFFKKWMEGPVYTKTNRIDGKVVIVTGCDRGIGKETALELARRGARVYMACLDFNNGEKTRLDIIERTNNPNVFNRKLDLSSFQTIREFVENFNRDEQHLDILINNAGTLLTTHERTKEGYEMHLAVNHLGHFLLTNLLLAKLKASTSGRIVVVASCAHKLALLRKDDINGDRLPLPFYGYFNSKLANVLFTRKFAEFLKDTNVTINCLHPGIVNSNIPGFKGLAWPITYYIKKPIMRTIKGGAQTSIFLALDPDMEGKSGGYYDRMKLQKYTGAALDDDLATWLWHESEIMVGLRQRDEIGV